MAPRRPKDQQQQQANSGSSTVALSSRDPNTVHSSRGKGGVVDTTNSSSGTSATQSQPKGPRWTNNANEILAFLDDPTGQKKKQADKQRKQEERRQKRGAPIAEHQPVASQKPQASQSMSQPPARNNNFVAVHQQVCLAGCEEPSKPAGILIPKKKRAPASPAPVCASVPSSSLMRSDSLAARGMIEPLTSTGTRSVSRPKAQSRRPAAPAAPTIAPCSFGAPPLPFSVPSVPGEIEGRPSAVLVRRRKRARSDASNRSESAGRFLREAARKTNGQRPSRTLNSSILSEEFQPEPTSAAELISSMISVPSASALQSSSSSNSALGASAMVRERSKSASVKHRHATGTERRREDRPAPRSAKPTADAWSSATSASGLGLGQGVFDPLADRMRAIRAKHGAASDSTFSNQHGTGFSLHPADTSSNDQPGLVAERFCFAPQWVVVGSFKTAMNTLVEYSQGALKWVQRTPKGSFQKLQILLSTVTELEPKKTIVVVEGVTTESFALVIKTSAKPSQVAFGFENRSLLMKAQKTIEQLTNVHQTNMM